MRTTMHDCPFCPRDFPTPDGLLAHTHEAHPVAEPAIVQIIALQHQFEEVHA